MRFSPEFIAKLKGAVDLVALVGETVQLRRSGKNLVGLSPFTKEKTPSFYVDPERQSFMCFSTNQGGDVFTYLEKTKGMSFMEAVAFVAERAGVELEASDKTPEQLAQERAQAEKKKALLKLNMFAARFFQEQLEGPAGAAARDYVKKRAITPASQLAFAIGFAPDSWTALRDYFLQIKAPMVEAYELGLFRTRNNEKPKADGSNMFDTFRNRLVFPIRAPQGEVLGFGGRWLGPSTAEAPKYLNSPESPVYEKDRILYNLDQARKPVRDLDCVVLVEGYMDCLALVQAGFTNTVANCGTALTRTQVGMLRKMANRVICLYDSDKAGQAAMEKAMNLFLDAEGLPLLGAHLPDGKDPDEFLREHGEAGQLRMAEILQNSPALLDEWISKTLGETPKTLQGRTEALNKIAAKLSKLRDDLAIQARLPGVGKGLEMDEGLLIEAIRKYKKGFLPGRELSAPARPAVPNAKTLPNRAPPLAQKSRQFQGASGRNDFGFQGRFLSGLLGEVTSIGELRAMPGEEQLKELAPVTDVTIRRVIDRLREPLREDETEQTRLQALVAEFREPAELMQLMVAASMTEVNDRIPPKGARALLRKLQKDFQIERGLELRRLQQEAESRGDMAKVEEYALLIRENEIQRKISQ